VTTADDPVTSVIKAGISAVEVLHKSLLDPNVGVFGPWQARRAGKAAADAVREIEAAKIEAIQKKLALRQEYLEKEAGLNPTALMEKLALLDLEVRAIKEAANNSQIVERAAELLNDEILEPDNPFKESEDWTTGFFNRSRDVSKEEMQVLFAKILAGEVVRPGSFSLRTIDFVNTLTTKEATFIYNACKYFCHSNDPSIELPGTDAPPIFLVLPGKATTGGSCQSMFEIDRLFEMGILAGAEKTLRYNGGGGNEEIKTLSFYRGRNGIVLRSKQQPPSFKAYTVTNLGRELFQLSDIKAQTKELAFDLAAEVPQEVEVFYATDYVHNKETGTSSFINAMRARSS
jgi:hypothetical protein